MMMLIGDAMLKNRELECPLNPVCDYMRNFPANIFRDFVLDVLVCLFSFTSVWMSSNYGTYCLSENDSIHLHRNSFCVILF